MSFEIKQLRIFPFKSLKGIDVDECEIDEYGFRHDRIYMLVHKGPSGYTAVTQRGEPVMSLIGQKVEGDQLVLSYLDNSEKEVSLRLPLDITVWPTDLPAIDMELWSYPFTGLDIGNGQIKEFFIKFFTTFGVNKFTADNLTVIVAKTHRNLTDTHKLLDRENDASPSFQDIYPGTIMTTESYNDLCEHVSYLDDEAKISMDSFRMNILVETDEPWIEDDWKKLKIGGHGWVVAGPTPRCSMPAVDQDSGKTRKNRHPLPSLNRFRVLEKGGWPNFGLYLLNEDVNYKLHVGDKVQVIEMEARLTPILHALPYALRGVSTAEIPFNAVGQIVLPSSVPLPLATVLQSICEPCVLYRALDTSLKRYNPHGLLMQALFSSIRESLRSYLAFTSEVETQCMQPGFNLAAAQSVLLEPCIYLRLFHYILKQCTSNRNIHVLSIVWEFTNHGDPLVASYAQELFLAVNEPFERIKQEWENLGSLQLDLFDEFYVSQVGNEKRLTLIDRKIPIGVMSTEEIERSFQRGVAMYFIREVCDDLEFFGTGKTFTQIVEHSRQLLVENNQLMLHLRGLRDYMLLANGDFVDSLFRNDTSNFLMRPVVDVPNYQASEFFLTAIGDTKQVEEDPLISGAVDAKVLGIDKGAAGIQLWEALVGIYHIDSKPISRVVDAGAMEIYERCFALLWRVRFSVQSLNRSSGYLRNLAREIQLDHADFNALLNMHAEMTQTFLTLQTRLYYNVIEKEWLALHDLVHKPETLTIVQIKQAHEAYLGEIAAVAGNPAHFKIIDASTKEALALESTLDRLLVGNELNEFKSDLDHLKASVYPTIVKLMQLM